jgi:hypothetical protein
MSYNLYTVEFGGGVGWLMWGVCVCVQKSGLNNCTLCWLPLFKFVEPKSLIKPNSNSNNIILNTNRTTNFHNFAVFCSLFVWFQ